MVARSYPLSARDSQISVWLSGALASLKCESTATRGPVLRIPCRRISACKSAIVGASAGEFFAFLRALVIGCLRSSRKDASVGGETQGPRPTPWLVAWVPAHALGELGCGPYGFVSLRSTFNTVSTTSWFHHLT